VILAIPFSVLRRAGGRELQEIAATRLFQMPGDDSLIDWHRAIQNHYGTHALLLCQLWCRPFG
jgi:hypothetical protein